MKAFKNCFLFLPGLLFFLATPCFTQQYSLRDQKEIAHQAQLTLSMYKDLLNVISYAGLATASEIQELIRNSYSPSRSQLFYSEKAIIEDNLRPGGLQSGQVQDKTVKEYLQHFDLIYEKSGKATVDFYDFEVSNLKYSTYPYIKVKYTCLFSSKHKKDGGAYKAVERLAELKAEKKDNKWRTYITSIVYYNPENPVNSAKGDVVPDRNVPEDEIFSHLSNKVNGENSERSGEKTNAGSPSSLYREMSFEKLKSMAETAAEARDYTEAKILYAEALKKEPQDAVLKAEIEKLEKTIRNLALPESKYSVGAYQEAIEDYNKALKNDRNNPDYYFGRGRSFEKLGFVKEALKDYSKAIELDGNFLDALSSRARLYAETRQHHKAMADYALIISNPDYAAAYYPERALVRLKMGDVKGAVADYDAAIRLKPDLAELYYRKGLIHAEQKQTAAALEAFDQALARDPQHASSYSQRGLVYAALGKLPEASRDFERARALSPDESQLGRINKLALQYYKKAEGAMKEKSWNQALKSFNDALLIAPAFGQAWIRKGDAHFMLQEYDSAIHDYEKATEYNPFSTGYFKKGLAYEQKGNRVAAIGEFRKYIPVGKEILALNRKQNRGEQSAATLLENFTEDRAEIFYSLGYAQLMTYHYTDALENLDLAIHTRKFFPKAYFARGAALYALEDYPGAVANMEESLRMGLSEPLAFYSLGKAYVANKQMKEAVFSLSHALELDPGYVAAYKERARCYKSYSQYELALKDVNKALLLESGEAEDSDLIAQRGLLELHLNKIHLAKRSFDHALRLDENNGWALYGKACALAKEQRTKESLEWYRKAFLTRQIEWPAIENDPLIQAASDEQEFQELVKKFL